VSKDLKADVAAARKNWQTVTLMRTGLASSPGRLGASLLAVMLCAVLAQPAHALTSNTRFTSAVAVTKETAYRGVFEGGAEAHTGLFGWDNPVDRIDPSGHDGELISTMAAVGTVGILAAETAGPTIEAEGAAEVEIIEAETAEQVSMAQAELQQAFQSSGAAVGRAFQTFGRLAENTARNTINMALRNADVEIEENPAAAQNGTRYLDFALKQGSKYLKMEVKYNLPKSGAQLSRLAAQVNESVNAADGGTTVVWSLRAPPPATVQAVQQALGANYSKVVFKSGIGDLLTYLKTVF
jgi:hypothetical protein